MEAYSPEFESLIQQSQDYLRKCNAEASRFYGIGMYSRYEYDLDLGQIWWSHDEEPMVRAKVIVVGTLSSKSNTWLWAWANPHFEDVDAGDLKLVRQFGQEEGFAKLTEAQWDATEVDGWEMASIAARLLEAQGAYRSPTEDCQMFLLFHDLAFIPEEEKADYRPQAKKAPAAAPAVTLPVSPTASVVQQTSPASGQPSLASAAAAIPPPAPAAGAQPQPVPARRPKSTLLRLIVAFLLFLLVLFAALSWYAGSEVASPERRPLHDYHREFLADPAAHGMVLQNFTLSDGTPCIMGTPEPSGKLGERGLKLRDQFAKKGLPLPPAGQVHGTLVLAHGRKGRKEDYLLIAERLCAVGFRCLLADMPGHGDHPAWLIYYGVREAELPAKVLKEAADKFGFDARPAGLLGMSMGGSVAMHAAALPEAPWQALVVISSYHAFQPAMELQATQLAGAWLGRPWAAAAGLVYEWKTGMPLKDVEPWRKAEKLTMPTLMLHGTDDKVVPIESGRKLYAALPAGLEKQWVEVPTAGHDNVLITDFPLYATVAEWMLKHVK